MDKDNAIGRNNDTFYKVFSTEPETSEYIFPASGEITALTAYDRQLISRLKKRRPMTGIN